MTKPEAQISFTSQDPALDPPLFAGSSAVTLVAEAWCPQQIWPLRRRLGLSSSSSPGRNHVMPEAGSAGGVCLSRARWGLAAELSLHTASVCPRHVRGGLWRCWWGSGNWGSEWGREGGGKRGGTGPGVPTGRVSSASSLFWPLSPGPAGACLIGTCWARLSCAGGRTQMGTIPPKKHLTPGPPTSL